MKIYTAADLHFFHKKILDFCPDSRPFSDVDEMNQAIVDNCNAVIDENDTFYILGDISFGRVSLTVELLNQIKCKNKILISGNHDESYLRKAAFRECFTSIHDYFELKYNGTLVCMLHYPIMYWNKKHYNSIHIHGHLHSNPSGISGKIKDVGLDTNNCKPYLLDDIITSLSHIEVTDTHHD